MRAVFDHHAGRVLLILVALIVWSLVGYRLFMGLGGRGEETKATRKTDTLRLAEAPEPFQYEATFEDPFRPEFEAKREPAPKKNPGSNKQTKSKNEKSPKPPPFRLAGIVGETALLWGPEGKTHLVGRGDSLYATRIVEVAKKKVVFTYRERRFTLNIIDN